MSKLLLVTQNQSTFSDMVPVIEKMGGTVDWAVSGQQALERIGKQTVDAVVADESVSDMTGLELIKKIVALNPMINSVWVSSLGKEEYHEVSEGLGVLMQLPAKPERTDAERLMTQLNQIMGYVSKPNGE